MRWRKLAITGRSGRLLHSCSCRNARFGASFRSPFSHKPHSGLLHETPVPISDAQHTRAKTAMRGHLASSCHQQLCLNCPNYFASIDMTFRIMRIQLPAHLICPCVSWAVPKIASETSKVSVVEPGPSLHIYCSGGKAEGLHDLDV